MLTDTFTKGDATDSCSFTYTVLSKPDIYPPVVVSTIPANNSTGILWNTREITITFDEDIKAVTPENSTENYGIVLNGAEKPNISVWLSKNTLSVEFAGYLKPGKDYVLVVPSGTLTDNSGNDYNDEIKIAFIVEPKPERAIDVVSSSPGNKEKDVSCETDQISVVFSYSDVTSGNEFDKIALLDSSGNKLSISKEFSEGVLTLTLNPGVKLRPAEIYEILIPADSVKDRFENRNVQKSIQFRTKSSDTLPYIVDFYPSHGQTGVDINQDIYVTFSEPVHYMDIELVLMDSQQKQVKTYISPTKDPNTVVIKRWYDPLTPNTTYTVIGPYDIQDDNSGLGYEMTTGANALGIIDKYVLVGDLPINTPIEIPFSAALSEGTEFNNIRVLNSNGNQVRYTISISNHKLVLAPSSPLSPSEPYTFCIPKGALKGAGNQENDEIRFIRYSAPRLNYGDYSFYMQSPWVTGKVLTFNARWLGQISRSLKSVTWDFGDGKTGSGLYPYTIYYNPGEYQVVLTLVDEMDITYTFEQTLTINPLSLNDAILSVNPNDSRNLLVFDDNKKNIETFGISLYSPTLGYLSDETVNVGLYKNGKWLNTLCLQPHNSTARLSTYSDMEIRIIMEYMSWFLSIRQRKNRFGYRSGFLKLPPGRAWS